MHTSGAALDAELPVRTDRHTCAWNGDGQEQEGAGHSGGPHRRWHQTCWVVQHPLRPLLADLEHRRRCWAQLPQLPIAERASIGGAQAPAPRQVRSHWAASSLLLAHARRGPPPRAASPLGRQGRGSARPAAPGSRRGCGRCWRGGGLPIPRSFQGGSARRPTLPNPRVLAPFTPTPRRPLGVHRKQGRDTWLAGPPPPPERLRQWTR